MAMLPPPRRGPSLAQRCTARLVAWMPEAFTGEDDPLAIEIGEEIAARIGRAVSLREPVAKIAAAEDHRFPTAVPSLFVAGYRAGQESLGVQPPASDDPSIAAAWDRHQARHCRFCGVIESEQSRAYHCGQRGCGPGEEPDHVFV